MDVKFSACNVFLGLPSQNRYQRRNISVNHANFTLLGRGAGNSGLALLELLPLSLAFFIYAATKFAATSGRTQCLLPSDTEWLKAS